MCELFGLSSNRPAPAGQLHCRYGTHGGDTADNPGGWGPAMPVVDAFHLTKEPLPAAHSACIKEPWDQVRSSLTLAHMHETNPPPVQVASLKKAIAT